MKSRTVIHLFEPGSSGHRPVISTYVRKVLDREGIDYVYDQKPLSSCGNMLRELDERAQAAGGSLTHVLTLDDHFRNFLRSSLTYRKRVPLVGTYYLYNNLAKPGVSAAIRCALPLCNTKRLLVSDEDRSRYRWNLEKRADYLADPWDPEAFPERTKEEARFALRLSPEVKIFLLFGSLTARKGAVLAIEAFLEANAKDHGLLLLAGKPDEATRVAAQRLVDQAQRGLRCDFQYIPEALVSTYFFATDYVLSVYPAWFEVSSGTFTRACAAGRPSIVGHHGALARRVIKHNCGITYETGDRASLTAALRRAMGEPSSLYLEWAENAKRLGLGGRLECYGKQLVEAYGRALS